MHYLLQNYNIREIRSENLPIALHFMMMPIMSSKIVLHEATVAWPPVVYNIMKSEVFYDFNWQKPLRAANYTKLQLLQNCNYDF